jgi:hypothetical protein
MHAPDAPQWRASGALCSRAVTGRIISADGQLPGLFFLREAGGGLCPLCHSATFAGCKILQLGVLTLAKMPKRPVFHNPVLPV